MGAITGKYKWLEDEHAPKMLVEGIRHWGVLETPGPRNNKSIMSWADELGLGKVYTSDQTAWCGLFMALLAKRAGKPVPASPLWALNWSNWGHGVDVPMLDDVLVFKRTGGGHVAMYVGEDKDCYHIFGGNQGDKVGVLRIAKNRLYAARRPQYSIGQPDNVRRIFLAADGVISVNEA